MSILGILSRRVSKSRPPAQCGEATIACKQANTRASIVGVAVRLEDGPPALYIKLERAAIIELSDELLQSYKRGRVFRNRWKMTDYFYGYAIDGVRNCSHDLDDATRRRLGDSKIIFTRFVGVQLGVEWGRAVELAVALACFHALGDPPLTRKLEMGEWKEI